MKKVICTLPNASNLINGVAFSAYDKGPGVVSDVLEDAVANQFAGIPGYSVLDPEDDGGSKPARGKKAAADDADSGKEKAE